MEKAFEQTPSSCVKIVLFGPESSGKTTLTAQLAAHFNSKWVPEYMRTYLELKWKNSKKSIGVPDPAWHTEQEVAQFLIDGRLLPLSVNLWTQRLIF